MNPWVILAVLLALGGYGSGCYYEGDKHATDACKAAQLATERAAATKYRAEVARGNGLSARLAAAESRIQIKTVERIVHVKDVTTGRDCLSAGAVSLLNGADQPRLSSTAGQPAAESAGAPAATDTDVADWIVSAQGQYDTCAARLNALIDYVEPPSPQPSPARGEGANVTGD